MSAAQGEKEAFWVGVHKDYARLKADSVAWLSYQTELALFQGESLDGLEGETPYYSPQEEADIRVGHARTRHRRDLGR